MEEKNQNINPGDLIEQMRHGFGAINSRFDKIEENIGGFEANIDTKIESVRTNLDAKIESIGTDIDTKIESVKTNLEDKIEFVKTELIVKIEKSKEELSVKIETEIEGLALMTKNSFDAYDRRFEEMEHQMEEIKNLVVASNRDARISRLEGAVLGAK